MLPLETILLHLNTLQQPGYPLEGYNALQETILVNSFRGTCANLPVYIAYRTPHRQLIVGIAGTTCFKQALQDLRAIRIRHSSKRGYVHTGFWDLYRGVRDEALRAIERGLSEHDVSELVLTGHSMGGSVSYLLCLDLLSGHLLAQHKPKLKVVTFGAPRTGEADLVKYFRDLVDSYRQTHVPDAFTELAVKGYNDGQSHIYTFPFRALTDPITWSTRVLFLTLLSGKKVSPRFRRSSWVTVTLHVNLFTQKMIEFIRHLLQNPSMPSSTYRMRRIIVLEAGCSRWAGIITTTVGIWSGSFGG